MEFIFKNLKIYFKSNYNIVFSVVYANFFKFAPTNDDLNFSTAFNFNLDV